MNFGDRIRRFLAGRYGMDALNKTLFIIAILLMAVLWFFPVRLLEPVVLILLVVAYFRFFSRNITARYSENRRFLRLVDGPRRLVRKYRYRFGLRHTYRFYRCPRCRKEMRVPKGKGKIEVRCPQCGERFIKKS